MIQVNELTKTYPDGTSRKQIFGGVSFSLNQSESLALTGESGSGKSTLLHLLAALDTADSGQIQIDSRDISQLTERQADEFRKNKVGIVFQHFNLVDCLSGWDNVCLPARLKGNFDQAYLENLLEMLAIVDLKNKLPVDMSGGEQQRFAIARALANKPALLLADEPTGNLDDKTSNRVSDMLFQLCQQLSTTLILVTHSQELAKQTRHHLHLLDGALVTA